MKKPILFLLLFLGFAGAAPPAVATDGLYLGGEVGFTGLGGDASNVYNDALGFGVDLGVRTNPLLDVLFSFQHSSHGNKLSSSFSNLTINSGTVSALLHFLQVDDFDLYILGGPGFYFFNNGASNSRFGLHGGAGADVIVSNTLNLGVVWRYNGVFSGDVNGASFWTVMMRVGVFFDFGS